MRTQDLVEVLGELAVQSKTMAAGAELFMRGDECGPVYVVRRGWVFLYDLLDDGRRQILTFGGPGSVLGLSAPGAALRWHSAACLGQVELSVIPRQRLFALARRTPAVAMLLASAAAGELASAYGHLMTIGRRSALERVAYLLAEIYLRWRAARPTTLSEPVELPMTQEHIGDALGLTAVHVCRMIRALKELRLVATAHGHLQLLDPGGLAELANIDVAELEEIESAAHTPAAANRDGFAIAA